MSPRLALLPALLLAGACSFDAAGLPAGPGPDITIFLPDSAPPKDAAGDARWVPDVPTAPDAAPGPDGPGCAWAHRRKLTFAASTLTENLIDVPVLVTLDATRVDYVKLQPGGADLRFTDADGVTALPHEVERWDPSGRSFIWVEVPQIDAGSTVDHIWLYYGNASPTPAPAGSVWSSAYLGVWHLDDDPTAAAPQLKDSSGGQVDLTAQGGIPSSALGAGKVGLGLTLDGASHYLTGKLAAAPPPRYTLSAWIRLDVVNSAERHIVELDGVQFFVESNGKLEAGTGNEFNVNGPTVLAAKTWYHVAFVQGLAGWAIYLDGKQEAGGAQITSPGAEIYVGHIYSPASWTRCASRGPSARRAGSPSSSAR